MHIFGTRLKDLGLTLGPWKLSTPFMVKVGITAAHAQQSLALTQCSVLDGSLWRVSKGRRCKSVGGKSMASMTTKISHCCCDISQVEHSNSHSK